MSSFITPKRSSPHGSLQTMGTGRQGTARIVGFGFDDDLAKSFECFGISPQQSMSAEAQRTPHIHFRPIERGAVGAFARPIRLDVDAVGVKRLLS